jgi:7-keto-8-aminopelargonate synthetase-like enzyme/acyl carrier protein
MAAAIDIGDAEKLDPASYLEVFTALLKAPATAAPAQLGVSKMRWKRFLDRWAGLEIPPFYAAVAGAKTHAESERGALADSLRLADPETRGPLIKAHLIEVLRQVLGLEPGEAVADDQPWADFGLDSLMMVEVKNRLERSLRLTLPVEVLMKDVTVDSLVAYLAGRIAETPGGEDRQGVRPDAADQEDAIRAEILEHVKKIPQAFATVEAQQQRKVLIDGRWRIDFASCNYLGFDLEPEVMSAIGPAVEAWGVHPSWTRAVASPALYAELERELAETVGAPDTLVFPSISLLHLGVLPTLAGGDGVILKDVEAHHSIYEACQKAQADGADWLEFRHNDVEDLERRLSRIRLERPKIIATDGAYSMGSPNPPLHEYVRLARTYNATLYVDDAHGFGIFGERPDQALPYGYGGNGIVRHMGLDYEEGRIVYVAGLSKAFSSYAALVTCHSAELKTALQMSGPYVFSGPTSVASLATALAGLKLNRKDGDGRRAHIHRLTRRLVAEARRIGFEVDNDGDFPIVGVVMGGWEAMTQGCGILWERDILITPATFPAVSINRNLVRFSLTSANTEQELDQAVAALEAVWAGLNATPSVAVEPEPAEAATA